MRRAGLADCPVAGCGNVRERWRSVCHACWRRLPVDLRAAIDSAKAEKAPHRVARAEIAATRWLAAHAASAEIERLLGEHEAPRHPPP
jgi:hypothetical protein